MQPEPLRTQPPTDRLRVGIGTSENADATVAGRAAALQATAQLSDLGDQRERAGLVIVYATVEYDLPALLASIRQVTGDAPLTGATSSGQFHNGGVTAPGAGVAVLVLSGGPYRFGVGSVTGVRESAFAAGQEMARAAREAIGPGRQRHAALMILVDGLAGEHQHLLNGIHRVTGSAVPVVGGAAGDDRHLERTCVFDGDQVLDDGAVAVWIDSPRPLTVVAEHGWQPVGLPLLVTKVDGPVVHEVAGRPATDVFRDHFRHEDRYKEPGWIRRPGYHSAHAFGLIEPDGSQLIRGAYLDDDGLLRTFSPLPTYSAIQIVSCQADDLLRVTDGVVRRAVADQEPAVVLAFSCVARWDILRENGAAEAARLQSAAGEVPTFGFYTYGEFARTTRVAGFHNATLTAIAL